jgi:GNAT superfamily N-acetyltransferase
MGNPQLVALVEGRVQGFATVLPRPDGDAELGALFVEPHAWRRGIGRALVDRCLVEAAHGGAQALHVIGNPHAQSFYDACGFATYGAA